MNRRATGTFEVRMLSQAQEGSAGTRLARLSLDKRYQGDLDGAGIGEMLSAVTDVTGSAGYVAIEYVSGTLHGQTGTFVLQHAGTMSRGAQELSITVVPDSGTGGLTGLAGKLDIRIVEGKHFYDFEYTLPG